MLAQLVNYMGSKRPNDFQLLWLHPFEEIFREKLEFKEWKPIIAMISSQLFTIFRFLDEACNFVNATFLQCCLQKQVFIGMLQHGVAVNLIDCSN